MYDKAKADHAVNFINCLKHTKGRWRGVPFELLPWQDEIIRILYGTVKENGYRQYNTCYCEIPKKNGKSELAAAIALYMTCGDGEWGAEVYGCASDRQQASIVFDVAVDMVDQCPALKKRIKPVMSVKRLVYKPTNSFYQVLSAEAYTKHGLNVHAVIFDELHAQPNRELFDVMTKGSGDARTQPLFFLITTAGTDRNSVCFEQHQKALDIIEKRKIDPTFYPVIYGASDEDDWSSEEVWYKANPSLGYTIDIEKVQNAYISAKENAAEENVFRQLRLNQWVKQSTRWMQMDKWDACSFTVNEEELLGRECYGGLDLSSSTDITAFVLVFPPRNDTEKYVILPYFWIPEDNMRLRVRRDHVPYDVWATEGYLKTTEGNVIHYGFIEQFIDELGTKFHIKEIAFDRWGAVQMVQNLEGMATISGQGLGTQERWDGRITVDEEIRLIELSGLPANVLHDNVTVAFIKPKKTGITQDMGSITMMGLMVPELYDNISFFVPIVRDVIETADRDKMNYQRTYVEDDKQFRLRKKYSLSGGESVVIDRGRAVCLTINTEPFQELTEIKIQPFKTAAFVNKHKIRAKEIKNTDHTKTVSGQIVMETKYTKRVTGAVESIDRGSAAIFDLGLSEFEGIETLEVHNG